MKKNLVFTSILSGLVIIGLACWLVMFLAGHDVWNFAGKPDFWHLEGPPHVDLRAFAIAFYAQFVALLALSVLIAWYLFPALRRGNTRSLRG